MGYEVEVTAEYIDSMFRRFMMLGFTVAEQGNLVAAIVGLHATPKGWTKDEIKHMLFYKKLGEDIDH